MCVLCVCQYLCAQWIEEMSAYGLYVCIRVGVCAGVYARVNVCTYIFMDVCVYVCNFAGLCVYMCVHDTR